MADRFVILCDVRSSHNVGAIFRTADAAGVKKIYLAGYTPTPIDRFGRENPKLSKTALGAAVTLPWEHVENMGRLMEALRAEGVRLVAVEQTPNASSLFAPEAVTDVPTAYIFGNEITGVPPEVLAKTDIHLELPMLGKKESLNVAVTVGIVLYHALFIQNKAQVSLGKAG